MVHRFCRPILSRNSTTPTKVCQFCRLSDIPFSLPNWAALSWLLGVCLICSAVFRSPMYMYITEYACLCTSWAPLHHKRSSLMVLMRFHQKKYLASEIFIELVLCWLVVNKLTWDVRSNALLLNINPSASYLLTYFLRCWACVSCFPALPACASGLPSGCTLLLCPSSSLPLYICQEVPYH